MSRVLIVEDDTDLASLMEFHLTEQHYTTDIAHTGSDALELLKTNQYNVALLDVQLPHPDGFELCKIIRKEYPDTAIIMVSNRANEVDRVLGLELGADDYVTKPFSVIELLARVKAVLRRSSGSRPRRTDTKTSIQVGWLEIDFEHRTVKNSGKELNLTLKEYELLSFFIKNPERPFSRQELLHHVWDYHSDAYDHTVSCHINRLRKKIAPEANDAELIQTVWGYGYKFVVPTEEEQIPAIAVNE